MPLRDVVVERVEYVRQRKPHVAVYIPMAEARKYLAELKQLNDPKPMWARLRDVLDEVVK